MSTGLVEKSESKTDWVKQVLYEIHFGKLIPLINFWTVWVDIGVVEGMRIKC